MFSKCQRLFRSPSMPCTVIRPILKRLERPQDKDMPVQRKRRRSVTLPEEQQQPGEPVSAFLQGPGSRHLPTSAGAGGEGGLLAIGLLSGFVADGQGLVVSWAGQEREVPAR